MVEAVACYSAVFCFRNKRQSNSARQPKKKKKTGYTGGSERREGDAIGDGVVSLGL